jgi:hypothetical protein
MFVNDPLETPLIVDPLRHTIRINEGELGKGFPTHRIVCEHKGKSIGLKP